MTDSDLELSDNSWNIWQAEAEKLREQLAAANALVNEQEIALARIFSDAGRLTEERDKLEAENARIREGGISGGGLHQFGPDIGEDGEIWQE